MTKSKRKINKFIIKCEWRPCGKEFEPKTDWQKFCGGPCRVAANSERVAEALRIYRESERRRSA